MTRVRGGFAVIRARLARHRKKLAVVVAIVLAGPAAHVAVGLATRIEPPRVTVPPLTCTLDGGLARAGRGYSRTRSGVREVYLEGEPEELGAEHARLLYDAMVRNESELWSGFADLVPFSPARTLVFDLGRVRYKDVDRGFPEARRRELAAQSLAFSPDPHASRLPTYQRMVLFHSLYDIALGFEHSPLLGCSAFGLGPETTRDGHTLLARAFDFEAIDLFDRDKAVFMVKGTGTIPFASVAWPGLVGAVTGMNAEGVAVVVNGGRAKEPSEIGLPVVFSLREVLERAHDTAEATAILASQSVMVSHIVAVADARGHFAIVERAPGSAAFVRQNVPDSRFGLTNHFEGPFAEDPRNQRVRKTTSTVARRARLDELLGAVGPRSQTIESAVGMLRDHACAASEGACLPGDRRSIDAFIATHGVVADTTAKVLWVSAGPHLSGRFVAFDLAAVFAPGHDPGKDPGPLVTSEDPALSDGRYEQGRARAGGPLMGKKK